MLIQRDHTWHPWHRPINQMSAPAEHRKEHSMTQVTPIPKCHICGADAMPNTSECIDHWNKRTDRIWAKRWGDAPKSTGDTYECEKCGRKVKEEDFISFSSGKDIWMCGTCRDSALPFFVEGEAS